MERYGIEWEQKGTNEKHLFVLDYKKQQRTEEIKRLESKITDKQTEFETLSKRIENFDKGTTALSQCRTYWRMPPLLKEARQSKQRGIRFRNKENER